MRTATQPPAGLPSQLGQFFLFDGKLAQYRGSIHPDRERPEIEHRIAVADQIDAGVFGFLVGQIPWVPGGYASWDGECRTEFGGRVYVVANDWPEIRLRVPVPPPGRGGRAWRWQWSSFSTEWRKAYR